MYKIKKKKDNSGYETRISLGVNPLTNKRIQKYMSAKTKTALVEKVNAYIQKHNNGELFSNETAISFQELTNLYLQYRNELFQSGFLSVSTFREDERKIQKDLLPFFEKANIKKLRKQDILTFREHLQNKSKKITNKTINKKMLVLKQILDFATERNYIHVSPYQYIKPLPEQQKEKDIWSPQEFKIFLDYVKKHEQLIYQAFFTLAFTTGARLSELLAFKWSDLEQGFWVINSTFVYDRKMYTYVYKERPKTKAGIRTVVLDEDTISIFKQLKQRHHDTFVFSLNGVCPNGKHFTNKFSKIIEYTNLREISFHGLRHSNVSYLLSLGIAPSLIAQRVGHSSSSFTERVYGHIILDAQKEIAQTLHTSLKLNSN